MDDEIDRSNWVEGKVHLTIRYDPNEVSLNAMAENVFRYCIECDGFGEITEIEVK
jgi:hypothetical protein